MDAAIHAASPSDATSADFDAAVASTVIDAFGDTAKPYLHTSGVWLWGSGDRLAETSPYAPPTMTAWRVDNERRLLESSVAVTIPAPGIVYGHGDGLAQMLVSDRDAGAGSGSSATARSTGRPCTSTTSRLST